MVSVHKQPHEVDLRAINFKEIMLVGTRHYTRKNYQQAIDMVTDLPVSELVSHRIGLNKAQKGFELMKKTKDVCKVIIEMKV